MPSSRLAPLCIVLVFTGVLAGCASNPEVMGDDNADPLEPFNRTVFTFNDTLDKAILKPVAQGYREVVPTFARDRVGNFFSNLDDVTVFVNDVLQLKGEQAAMDLSRIVYNTTFGLGGLFDVASSFGLPKHQEDFGQTLGYWGIGEGAYVVLPLLGPSTARGIAGRVGDSFTDPVGYIDPLALRLGLQGTDLIDFRADLIPLERSFEEAAAIDPYSFQREAYLQNRRNLVFDGNPPLLELDEELEEELFEDLDPLAPEDEGGDAEVDTDADADAP